MQRVFVLYTCFVLTRLVFGQIPDIHKDFKEDWLKSGNQWAQAAKLIKDKATQDPEELQNFSRIIQWTGAMSAVARHTGKAARSESEAGTKPRWMVSAANWDMTQKAIERAALGGWTKATAIAATNAAGATAHAAYQSEEYVAIWKEVEGFWNKLTELLPENGTMVLPNATLPPFNFTISTPAPGQLWITTPRPIDEMSIKEMRTYIHDAGLKSVDCMDRAEMRARTRLAAERLATIEKARLDAIATEDLANTRTGDANDMNKTDINASTTDGIIPARPAMYLGLSVKTSDFNSVIAAAALPGLVAGTFAVFSFRNSASTMGEKPLLAAWADQ